MRRQLVLLMAVACAVCTESSPTEFAEQLIACGFGSSVALDVGDMIRDGGGGASFCLESPDGGTYLLLPFVAGPRDTAATVTVSVFGGGIGPAPSLDAVGPAASLVTASSADAADLIEATDAWHHVLRAREHAELRQHAAGAATRPTPPRDAVQSPAAAESVAPGDLLALNVSARCDAQDMRGARVAAVTAHAIVTYDPANPTNGAFTDQDWQTFGTQFDALVQPVVTQNFGAVTDIDGNGRVILFFTRAVNEIVPPGGGIGIVGGFFWRGDLFPRDGIPNRTAPCANGNEAEVLYLAVPDPEGEVRGVPISDATLRQVMVATIGHELQHLVSSGRRLYITEAPVLEETWLNEGLSYIAEELLFYAAAGTEPRQNLTAQDILASSRSTDAFNTYGVGNLGRLNVFLQAPQDWSVMGEDAIPTRGAAWSFLRYLIDRDPRPDDVIIKALIDGQQAGLANLTAALGEDPLPWMHDWSLSLFTDDLVTGLEPRFEQPSWALRDIISALRPDQQYPLRILPIEPGEGFSVELQPGAAAYPLFALRPGTRAIIGLGADGETTDRTVRTVVMRVE
ncbi:MAG: hypothetical protein ACREM1_20275 [Longimicrobiales bacterium]